MSGNDVHVVGNLSRDPEVRFTPGGQAVANFGIAVNRRYQKDGEWVETVSFFDVVCWGSLADNVADSCTKGSRVMVSGRLDQRSWEDQDGQKRSKVEIVADEVGPSLRWAKAQVEKNPRQDGEGGGQRGGGQGRQSEPAGRTYGRGTPPPQGRQQGAPTGGYSYDEEPF